VVTESAGAHPLGQTCLRLAEILEQKRHAGQRAVSAMPCRRGSGGVEIGVNKNVELGRALKAGDRRIDQLDS